MTELHLSIFISSVLAGHGPEREAVANALKASCIADDWRFEHAPAAAADLSESYLRAVRECDLVVVLTKATITAPVVAEYDEARKHGRPVLVFVDGEAPRDAALADFLQNRVVQRWRTYHGLRDLGEQVVRALGEEVVRRWREQGGQSLSEERVVARIGAIGENLILGNRIETTQMIDGAGVATMARDIDLTIDRIEGSAIFGHSIMVKP